MADTSHCFPPHSPPTCKRADRKYYVSAKGMDFLFSYLQPNSLAVEAANYRDKQTQHRSTPQDKDHKRWTFWAPRYTPLPPCNFILPITALSWQNMITIIMPNSSNLPLTSLRTRRHNSRPYLLKDSWSRDLSYKQPWTWPIKPPVPLPWLSSCVELPGSRPWMYQGAAIEDKGSTF